MRGFDDFLQRRDGAEGVRDMRDRYDLGAVLQQALQLVDTHLAGGVKPG